VALVDVDEVFVDPAVGLLGGVVVEGLLVGPAADVAHAGDAPALDARPAVAVRGGQPPVPHVRRLDHVVVHADDLGDHDRIARCHHGLHNLTDRQIVALTIRQLTARPGLRMPWGSNAALTRRRRASLAGSSRARK
jgi:hypothetical protein